MDERPELLRLVIRLGLGLVAMSVVGSWLLVAAYAVVGLLVALFLVARGTRANQD